MILMEMQKKVNEVQDEKVNWSDDEDTQSVLVASSDHLYVGDGKWQNEAHGQPTNNASWTIRECSTYFLT